MSQIKLDISRRQREFARSKYASSSEDEDERRRSKHKPDSKTLGDEYEENRDAAYGSDSNGRWHGKSEDDHGQHARGSGTWTNSTFSKPSKPRRGDSHRREREARMRAHRDDDELGINSGRPKLEPKLEAASPHTPPNFRHDFFMGNSPSAPRKSFPWMEQSPQQEIFREPASEMTSPIKARGARQSLYTSGSWGRPLTPRSIGTSDGFSSFDDQYIRALAVEIRVNIMLTPCLLALRQGKSKTDLAEYECTGLTRSARNALALAQQHKKEVAKGTVARCYFYVALTQFAYSPDSIHKSDARALKWLRKTRKEFPGSSEADQAQLWVRALESATRQQQREISRKFDDWAVSDYNGDVIINRAPVTDPYPQPRRPPLQRAATWLRNLFGGARSDSVREDDTAIHTKAPTLQRQTTSQLRSDRSWSSDQSWSSGSWSSGTESLRGIILRNGPVSVREETSPSEPSPTHMGRNDIKDEQSNGRPAPVRSWSNYNPWHNSQAERPSTAESITRWVSEKLGYWLGSGNMSDAGSPISDRPMTRESAIPAPLDPRKQSRIPPPLDPRRQSRFKTAEGGHVSGTAPSRAHTPTQGPSSKSGQYASRDEVNTRSRQETGLDAAGLRRRRSRLSSLVPRLSIQKQPPLIVEDLAEKGESPIFWHE
ncbi:hypothetical protein CB0940_06928 [Cercospora beticola]|uniref:Uncharacterized protein n=1 Tax=Cercospora beticola TaxID=122368 RepID=A0A2G5H9G5_CERBT|nr:hypothetical protein CB0940_06928 [Cercospora beticola]PIA89167.1 hypothetical protein CB0940_06928 [Cercospora beticola]WPB02846.1 hypothetical protein RHO25_007482 [Cercospora beticola]